MRAILLNALTFSLQRLIEEPKGKLSNSHSGENIVIVKVDKSNFKSFFYKIL